MTAVRLRFKESTSLPVDARALAPDRLAGKPEAELAALELLVGNRRVPLGELAELTAGDAQELVIEGSFGALDRLGHEMAAGLLQIYGDAGAYLGQGMAGGRIELFGSAGIYAAAQMRGGHGPGGGRERRLAHAARPAAQNDLLGRQQLLERLGAVGVARGGPRPRHQ